MYEKLMRTRLEKLKLYRVKIEEMTSLHLVEHGFYDMSSDFSPIFYGDKDKVCHGFDAAGDLSGAFKLIKEAFLREIDFEVSQIEDQL